MFETHQGSKRKKNVSIKKLIVVEILKYSLPELQVLLPLVLWAFGLFPSPLGCHGRLGTVTFYQHENLLQSIKQQIYVGLDYQIFSNSIVSRATILLHPCKLQDTMATNIIITAAKQMENKTYHSNNLWEMCGGDHGQVLHWVVCQVKFGLVHGTLWKANGPL